MVVEIAKPADALGLVAYRNQQLCRVVVPCLLVYAQNLGAFGVADKMRVEGLAVAGDPVKGIQVTLQKVGARAHFGKDDKAFEFRTHIYCTR